MAGRFDERFLDEIKSRLRPSDVIGKTVKLRRQGREYVGLSPFTKEKTPSFYVNDDKGQFFDFSSGKTGDIITFVQETERLTFAEAVERLAADAGVPLPAVDPRAAEQEKKRQGLGDWLEAAALWFEGELRRPVGREARAYLERRGLPESEWSRFRLGFAPGGRTALKDYLITKGARPGDLVEAGLLIAPEDGGAPYDRFRDRIIFPITDVRGRVVSFGGRAMDPEARAKYLNGPETSVFHKGQVLYGLAGARKILAAAPAGETPPLVVVEGYMDVIACQRAGIAAAAAMGTALGEEQMELLWRHHPDPTLCFDGDRAGRQAAGRLMDRALPLLKPGRSFNFAIVEGGKDPDEVLREQGPAALKTQLAQTTPFAEALFLREREAAPLQTPEQRTALKVRLRKLAATVADADLAGAYKEFLLARYDALFPRATPSPYDASAAGRVLSERRWTRRGTPRLDGPTPEARQAAEALARSPTPFAAALAIAAVRDPAVIGARIEQISTQGFGDPRLEPLAEGLVSLHFELEPLNGEAAERALSERGFGEMLRLLARDAERAGVAAPFLKATGEQARALWLRAYDLLMDVRALETAVMDVMRDIERGRDVGAELISLKAQRDHLRRRLNSDWTQAEEGPPASLH